MDKQISLANDQKALLLMQIINMTKDKNEISFYMGQHNDIFGNINENALEEYLTSLSKKGYIHFGVFADGDGSLAEADLSIINMNALKNELSRLVNNNHANSNRKIRTRNIVNETLPIFLSVFGLLAAITSFLISKLDFSTDTIYDSPIQFTSFVLMLIVAIISLFSIMLGLTYFLKTRRKEESKEEIEEFSSKLKNTVLSHDIAHIKNSKSESDIDVKEKAQKREKPMDETDALRLMVVNMEEIKEYYTLSKKQATSSFVLAIWMCDLGFLLISSSVVVPLFVSLDIQISIISAIGGTIIELFAGTTLLVYRTSLRQLNHYYQSLHENERFLSCVNLVRKLSNTDAQDEMLKELIRSEISKKQIVGNAL